MSAAPPVLEVAGLTFARGPGPEDFRLSLPALALRAGEVVALLGESGSGKSTLLDLLGLVAAPGAIARYRLAGEDLTAALRAGDLEAVAPARRARLGYVLQEGGLLPFLTVAENIALTRPVGRPAPMALATLAERLGLAGVLGRKPDAISVGQRQRAAIARAAMGDPAVILADEPTAALDPPTARATLALLVELAAERGTAVLIATHSWALAAEFALPAVVARAGEGAEVVFAPAPVPGPAA